MASEAERGGRMKFEFFTVGRIIVERGGAKRLGELAGGFGRRVLLIHNAAGLVDAVAATLAAAGMMCELFRQRGEPTVESVGAAVGLGRACDADVLIGLGGGSAIDAAKAAAAILANGGEPLDYMEVVGRGQKIARQPLPWIAVPTTAGTGAEATRNAVIGYHEKQFKASIRSELMLPRMALLDAELAVGVPQAVTAASGADALCQVIESYTSLNANPISDGLALEGIARAGRWLRRAYDAGEDLEARENMAIAALLSGITLGNAGLGAVHGFAAPIGGSYPVPHGVVCAALLPHVIEANVAALRGRQPESPALGRYATIGRVLTGQAEMSDAAAIDAAVAFIRDLTTHMTIPRLREFGLSEASIAPMVELAKKASSMRYNPVVLSDGELARVLGLAI